MRKRGSRKKDASETGDVALIFDRAESSDGYKILRRRASASEVEMGTIRPLKEGRPIDGEVLTLTARSDIPFLYDVKTELPDPRRGSRPTSDGPPQIATEEYRRGWEAIWGNSNAEKLN
jgi:hypothetical protein